MSEREITIRDILDIIAGIIIFVSAGVGIFSLIWSAWVIFRIALTVFVAVVILTIIAETILPNSERK